MRPRASGPAAPRGGKDRRKPLIAEPLGEAILSLARGEVVEIDPGERLVLLGT